MAGLDRFGRVCRDRVWLAEECRSKSTSMTTVIGVETIASQRFAATMNAFLAAGVCSKLRRAVQDDAQSG